MGLLGLWKDSLMCVWYTYLKAIHVICDCMINDCCVHMNHNLSMTHICVCVFQGVGAVSVFKECARMRPEDPSLPLLAAKICIGQLHWVNTHKTFPYKCIQMNAHNTHTLKHTNLNWQIRLMILVGALAVMFLLYISKRYLLLWYLNFL